MLKAFSLLFYLMIFTTDAQSALFDRGAGMVYDDVLDVTWLKDAGYAENSGFDVDGIMTWPQALNWADQLEFAGYNDWRLPGMKAGSDTSVPACVGLNCNDTEFTHMYYINLSGDGSSRTSRFYDTTPFINITHQYWSSLDIDEVQSGNYHFSDGLQFFHPKDFEFAPWAVRDGDVNVTQLRCDLNNNGEIDAGDLMRLLRKLTGFNTDSIDCDMNNNGIGDGTISTADLVIISQIIAGLTAAIIN